MSGGVRAPMISAARSAGASWPSVFQRNMLSPSGMGTCPSARATRLSAHNNHHVRAWITVTLRWVKGVQRGGVNASGQGTTYRHDLLGEMSQALHGEPLVLPLVVRTVD